MKTIKKARMLNVVLLVVCFFAVFVQNISAKPFLSQDSFVLPNKTFPIMTWFGLRAEHFDRQHFQEMADAGFTINFSHVSDYETNRKALDIAQQVGIKLLISDSRIQPNKPVDEEALKKIDSVVADYKNHPALFGYHVRDEPGTNIFPYMGKIKERIETLDPNHLVYGNLLPDIVTPERLGMPTYEEYIEKFIEIFQPKILSYDHYPFINTGFRPNYYDNMEKIRAGALSHHIPFWAFTMSCAIDPLYPEPKEPWIRLQVFTDLVYGAKGIQYFTYGLPRSDRENFTIAILDDNGHKTYLYDIAKRLNMEIHALAPTLSNLVSIAVYHSEPLPQGTIGISDNFIIKQTSGYPVVIGYFKDTQNKKYMMLTSRDSEKSGDVKLTLSDRITGLAEISKASGHDLPLIGPINGIITFQLDPGDGRLFRIEE
jgi:hypothetical protein